jgi:hypothetical protein
VTGGPFQYKCGCPILSEAKDGAPADGSLRPGATKNTKGALCGAPFAFLIRKSALLFFARSRRGTEGNRLSGFAHLEAGEAADGDVLLQLADA